MYRRHRILTDLAPPERTLSARKPPPRASRAITNVVSDLAKKTKYVDPKFADHWPAIVGADIAALARPGRLTGRAPGQSLEIFVQSPAAATQVQMMCDDLLTRLNKYLGPRTVARITIKHANPDPVTENTQLGRALASFRSAVQNRNKPG